LESPFKKNWNYYLKKFVLAQITQAII
jgi:hypothetical protein